MDRPKEIVNQLLKEDAFSNWLGIEIIEVKKGYCKLKMTVRQEMANGFGIAHGGISYSLADTCLAFAVNSNGKHSMSVDTSIAHTKSAKVGEVLTAESKELSLSNRIALYSLIVRNEQGENIAFFRGTYYIRTKEW